MNELDKRDLSELANAPGQLNQPTRQPGGYALTRATSGIAPVGAQPVAVRRDESIIRQKLAEHAAMAGDDWFYRYPIKSSDGSQNYAEGPTIKLANDVARIYMNNDTQVRELDVGDAWVFMARFTDIETGFSMERLYRQRKSQISMKTKDADRQQDIAYQIGQSKAIRNVIVNALQSFCDFAFREAQNSIVQKIGKSLDSWRERTIEGAKRMPVDIARIERVIGRAAKNLTAPDIARIVAMMQAVADGMSTTDDVFPPLAKPETPTSGKAATAGSPGAGEAGRRSSAGDPGTAEEDQ